MISIKQSSSRLRRIDGDRAINEHLLQERTRFNELCQYSYLVVDIDIQSLGNESKNRQLFLMPTST